MSELYLLAVWGTGVAVSLAVTGFTAAAGLGDVPGVRSSHDRVTPTAGGLGILAGLAAALIAAAPIVGGGMIAALVSLVFACALIGLYDDIYRLRAGVKFALVLAVSILAVRVTGPVVALPTLWGLVELGQVPGWTGSVLWLFVVVNAVNFMDGINGIMAGTVNAVVLVVGAVAASLGRMDVVWLAVASSAGMVGFLPYNFRERARVFAGDVGALPVGLLVGVMPLMIASDPTGAGLQFVYLGPLLLLPFLTDVMLTLLRKVRRRQPFLQAHRDHLYQRLSRASSHTVVSTLSVLLVVPLAGLALSAMFYGVQGSLLGLLGVAAALSALHWAVSRKLEH